MATPKRSGLRNVAAKPRKQPKVEKPADDAPARYAAASDMAQGGSAAVQKVSEQDRIVMQCRAEYQAGLLFRRDREVAWHTIEDAYFNRAKKSLKGKFNVPVPILPGFVDTWTANMARHVDLEFEQTDEGELLAVKKANALLQAQKSHEDHDWDEKDTDGKKMAGLSGRAIYEKFAESAPRYKDTLELVDHYDFICDPVGGGTLENHRFVQRDNIFRSRSELKEGAEAGTYDPAQVSRLINATRGDVLIDNDNVYRSKQNRMTALGLDGITHNYAGQALYKLIECGTTWHGKRYYVLFNYETGIWVRCQPLEEVFESGLWWFTSWATNRDPFNFWSKGPCDDMFPLGEMLRVLLNQELDNRNKRNYGMRAYDPAVFADPAQLEWRSDGLVATKENASLKGIGNGLYEFQTAELNGTIDLTQYIDALLKEKTGVNSESQGQADSSKVGIAYLNLQQSSQRTALVYESYSRCWQAIGRRFLWGLKEHMREAIAVKVIGEKGAEWDELRRTEINPEWGIRVKGGDEDLNRDAMKQKQLIDTLAGMAPDEMQATSPKWRARAKLQAAGVADEEVRLAFDLSGDADREIISRASQMIDDVLEGKQVRPYRGATTAFCQHILDFATDSDLKMPDYMKLIALVQAHMKIAAENAVRRAMLMRTAQGAGMPTVPKPGQPKPPMPSQAAQPMLGAQPQQPPAPQPSPAGFPTPGGTQATSQQLSNLNPNAPAAPGA